MRKFLESFELTVAQQRVVIVLLLTFVAVVAVRTFSYSAIKRCAPASAVQPSPSPGTRP